MSKILFALATAILAWGVYQNIHDYHNVADAGSVVNGFYILAIAVYVASVAAELIWGEARAKP